MPKPQYDLTHVRADAEWLAALAEPARLRLVDALLRDGPRSVSRLAEAVGVPMVNASHHLGVMKKAGIVEDTRSGRERVYAMVAEAVTGRTLTNGRVSVTL